MTLTTSYMNTAQASARLGIARQTLYAYVSRGLLRAYPSGDTGDRTSRYLAAEVDRLATERKRGRKPRDVARKALHWGMPVLESGITLIASGQPYFRGTSAVALSERSSLEEIAARLWQCEEAQAFPRSAPKMDALWKLALDHYRAATVQDRLIALFAVASAGIDTGAWPQPHDQSAQGCGALLRLMAASMLGRSASALPLHRQCAGAWRLDETGTDLVREALVLCADHELNASSFTVRCVASTQAAIRLSIVAGLAALSGARHGGVSAQIEALFDELEGASDTASTLKQRLLRGESIPGFGHPLYPEGDPRAAAILRRVYPTTGSWVRTVRVASELSGQAPTLDVALVILRRHLRLPPGTAFGLFALGRTVGWIAHALEQQASPQLIRPRAAYTGPLPEPVADAGGRRAKQPRRDRSKRVR